MVGAFKADFHHFQRFFETDLAVCAFPAAFPGKLLLDIVVVADPVQRDLMLVAAFHQLVFVIGTPGAHIVRLGADPAAECFNCGAERRRILDILVGDAGEGGGVLVEGCVPQRLDKGLEGIRYLQLPFRFPDADGADFDNLGQPFLLTDYGKLQIIHDNIHTRGHLTFQISNKLCKNTC
ncbi:hypothetical protein D3C75_834850 [compost metagenome]